MTKIKIEKLKSLRFKDLLNVKKEGFTFTGEGKKPKVGSTLFLTSKYRHDTCKDEFETTTILEVSKSTFKTKNSLYKYEIIT